MIRCFPTTLVLGLNDLKDYNKRQRHRKLLDAQSREATEPATFKQGFPQYTVSSHDRPSFVGQEVVIKETCPVEGELHDRASSIQTMPAQGSGPIDVKIKAEGDQASTGVSDLPITGNRLEKGHGYGSIGPEDFLETFELHQSSSPSRDDFHYGGFVQSPCQDSKDVPRRFSPLRPDDVSTPQNISVPEPNQLRARAPLPRSPLFISQNVSSSPERRATAGLTPHVASRVATHNTPGIIFSQPARRPPRRNTRNFRHQTNSFSFHSSEWSSAAYEQRIASSSTSESTARPSGEVSLHEELQGSSLQSSSVTSGASSSSSDVVFVEVPSLSLQHKLDQTTQSRNDLRFSSPQLSQLSLPPPFSTASRSSSRAEVLPSVAADSALYHPLTSPIRSLSSSPAVNWVTEERPTHSSPPEYSQSQPALNASPITGTSPGTLFQRAARVFSAYRSRTPSSPDSSSNRPPPSASLIPRQSQVHHSSRELDPQTISRSYRVYNDTLSPGTQPQTPIHLPEARHQSRFHPSYTAPVVIPPARPGSNNIGNNAGNLVRHRQVFSVTPSRRGMGRTQSPIGLLTGGFQGLYGGRENGDEEQNWAEGVRFNNAELRLWGLRDARDDGRSMRETPEPEDWRVGRRQ